jgi:hypothetical protein
VDVPGQSSLARAALSLDQEWIGRLGQRLDQSHGGDEGDGAAKGESPGLAHRHLVSQL